MLRSLFCLIWGHAVHNAQFAVGERACTRCGLVCLGDDSQTIRVGHTLSCFFTHHTYERVTERDGHTEYACVQCGHPLLFRTHADPYDGRGRFTKRVRYLCGLFGHHVHAVTERDGGTEYACHCGHSFVRHPDGEDLVRHPLMCVVLGHWVSFIRPRGAFSEYACRHCGHPFLFARKESRARQAGLTQGHAEGQRTTRAA
jgi:DNA-directed RNA polymerase subunit RPC12/RpoP